MKIINDYKHLKGELLKSECKYEESYFEQVMMCANRYELNLNDEDFKRLFKLRRWSHDTEWIMEEMSKSKVSLADALVSYCIAGV